jgi:long-chain acyl-CoA synthetase
MAAGAEQVSGAETLAELLAGVERQNRGGLMVSPPGQEAAWREISWGEVIARACQAVDALAGLGLRAGDRLAIAAGNSLEWILADLAAAMAGLVLVPLHTSLSGEQLAWQVRHSGSRLLIGEEAALHKVRAADEPRLGDLTMLSVSEWAAAVSAASASQGRERWNRSRTTMAPDSLASLVYTSGTSGEPKGVILTQRNLAANAQAVVQRFGGLADEVRLNVLPFSHAYGRMSDLYVSLAGTTWLALARSRETLLADAVATRPTLLVVVPLLLSRLRQAALATFGPDDPTAVRKLLGGRVRGFVSGGARLETELAGYFAAQQTPVWEGYGLTEAAPVVTLSSDTLHRDESVGQLALGEARIASDGELLVRGPHVMAGYWQDAEATAQTVRDGWLHTGDLATIDDDGYVFLRGRNKDYLVLASGKKVWPQTIEAKFADDPLVEQIVVVGEGERHLGALVVPRQPAIESAAMLSHLASKLQSLAAHEQIKQVALLREPWTASRDELTPKMTLRRSVILQRYAEQIQHLFDGTA